MMIDTEIVQRVTRAMHCSKCGVEAAAACDCGAPYLPATARAAKAIAENPGKSDRAIAAEIGVSDRTVNRARSTYDAVEKRVGADGKARKQPAKKAAAKRAIDDPREWDGTRESCTPPPRPTEEQAVRRQGHLNRASEAVRLAHYDHDLAGLVVDKQILNAVKKAAEAWAKLYGRLIELGYPESPSLRQNPPPPDSEEKKLNALGKPISPNYDPKYKRKTPLTSINRLRAPWRVSLAEHEAAAKREAEEKTKRQQEDEARADAHIKDFRALENANAHCIEMMTAQLAALGNGADPGPMPESLRRTATT
jgi:hypothetical protein